MVQAEQHHLRQTILSDRNSFALGDGVSMTLSYELHGSMNLEVSNKQYKTLKAQKLVNDS